MRMTKRMEGDAGESAPDRGWSIEKIGWVLSFPSAILSLGDFRPVPFDVIASASIMCKVLGWKVTDYNGREHSL